MLYRSLTALLILIVVAIISQPDIGLSQGPPETIVEYADGYWNELVWQTDDVVRELEKATILATRKAVSKREAEIVSITNVPPPGYAVDSITRYEPVVNEFWSFTHLFGFVEVKARAEIVFRKLPPLPPKGGGGPQ